MKPKFKAGEEVYIVCRSKCDGYKLLSEDYFFKKIDIQYGVAPALTKINNMRKEIKILRTSIEEVRLQVNNIKYILKHVNKKPITGYFGSEEIYETYPYLYPISKDKENIRKEVTTKINNIVDILEMDVEIQFKEMRQEIKDEGLNI